MEFKPISGREFPRFSAIKTFFRLPIAQLNDPYDVALFGVPFDGGVSYRPGARFAPSQIREYSSLGRGFHWSRGVNIFENCKFADLGDAPIVPIDLEKSHKQIEDFAFQILQKGKKAIAIGGDHSTTLPLLRAIHKKHGPVRLIHFDAHLDTYPAAWGCEYHHGSFLRHVVDEGLIKPSESWQFGLRGPLAEDKDLEFVQKNKFKSTTVDDIRIPGLESFLSKMPEFGNEPVYITFDIDCLDPAYAPGTGTPVPGGLTTYETQRILRALKIKNLVGADIVEVCPAYDPSGITSMAAVDTLFEMMSIIGSR